MAQYNQSLKLSVICFLKEMTFKLVEQSTGEITKIVVEFKKIPVSFSRRFDIQNAKKDPLLS